MADATGGGGSGFPATRLSAIAGVMAADPAERARGRDVLSRVYWKPIYKYVRLRWRKPPDEAEEVTQEFFLRCLDQDTFAVYRPEQGRFRTFLRSCLDRFVEPNRAAAGRRRRRDLHLLASGGIGERQQILSIRLVTRSRLGT
jgi:DNA-directed RNA polymerase specialized sigma24 family protein